jgi:hypothetical protein
MHKQSASQFWFEPGGFWGHDLILISQFYQLRNRGRMKGKRYGIFTGIDQFDQLIVAADATDEVDSLVGARE